MESGVHGVESEAAVCPGRRITGVSGSRWTSCGAGTGARDTLEGVAGITIPPEQPQSLPKALLRHPTVRYRARRPPRRSPGLAHFVILRPGLRQTPSIRCIRCPQAARCLGAAARSWDTASTLRRTWSPASGIPRRHRDLPHKGTLPAHPNGARSRSATPPSGAASTRGRVSRSSRLTSRTSSPAGPLCSGNCSSSTTRVPAAGHRPPGGFRPGRPSL